MNKGDTMKKLLIIPLLFLGCYQATVVHKEDEKPILVFYDAKPTGQYAELQRIIVTFREYGIMTGKGSAELMVDKLKNEARELDADAIINVQIDTEPIAGQMNTFWKASATAVKIIEK